MKLNEVMKLTNGVNSSRVGNDNENFYDPTDFRNDLNYATDYSGKESEDTANTHEGQMLFSIVNGNATIVSKQNAGKLIKDFFIKVEVDTEKIYPWYLCYLINESEEVKRAKYINNQGSTIARFTNRFFREIDLQLPDMDKQKSIGDLYKLALNKYYLEEQAAKNNRDMILNNLSKM